MTTLAILNLSIPIGWIMFQNLNSSAIIFLKVILVSVTERNVGVTSNLESKEKPERKRQVVIACSV